MLNRVGGRAIIGLLVVAAHHDMTSIEEIRQRLENAKAHYQGEDPEGFNKAMDNFVASLRARYGEQVPVADAARLMRELPLAVGKTTAGTPRAGVPGSAGEKAPDGVRFEWTPAGFLLRVSCGSLITGAPWAIFAGLLAAIPFILWGDLIRGVWTDEGLSFWMTSAFLAIWAGAVLWLCATATVGLFGEIRIAKDGGRGEIFTGIGRVGWTHRVQWSEFEGVSEREVQSASSGRSSHTSRYVGLNGKSKRYRFGSEMTEEQRAFVIQFLGEHVFGVQGGPLAG
jgi:hypothetical protein